MWPCAWPDGAGPDAASPAAFESQCRELMARCPIASRNRLAAAIDTWAALDHHHP